MSKVSKTGMGIREQLSGASGVKIAAAFLVIAIAVVYVFHSEKASTAFDQAYYTVDDGQSLFTADMNKVTPFDYRGKPAVRAWAFTCDNGKTRFVAYLERYTAAAKPKYEAAMADFSRGKTHMPPSPEASELEVKKPGPNNPWVLRTDPKAWQITHVICPDGGSPQPLFP